MCRRSSSWPEHHPGGVRLHQVVAAGLCGDVLEDDLHPRSRSPGPSMVAVGRKRTRSPSISKETGSTRSASAGLTSSPRSVG